MLFNTKFDEKEKFILQRFLVSIFMLALIISKYWHKFLSHFIGPNFWLFYTVLLKSKTNTANKRSEVDAISNKIVCIASFLVWDIR